MLLAQQERVREEEILLLLKAANCVLCRNSIYFKGEYIQVVEIQIQIPNHLARSTYQQHLIFIVEVKRERGEKERKNSLLILSQDIIIIF